MHTRFLHLSERVRAKRFGVYQNRTTDTDCDCKYKVSNDELHVSEWVYTFWNDVYSDDIVRILVSIWRRKYNYRDERVSHNHWKLSFGRKRL